MVVAFFGMITLLLATAIAALALGSVKLPPGDVVTALLAPDQADRSTRIVVRDVRVPRTLAAVLTGAALAVCGAQMQTVFRNPLAGPSVLGVTAGAGFGVAVVVLTAGSDGSAWTDGVSVLGGLGVVGAALIGAVAAMAVSLAVARRVQGMAAVLIVGMMIGAFLTALVSILTAAADPQRLQQFVTWGYGSFRGVTLSELRIMGPVVVLSFAIAVVSTKALNALLVGERYAESMGVAVRRVRFRILVSVGALAGVVTAFVGPVGFIGIAAPHLARPLLGSSDHRLLLPGCALIGATLALLAEVVAQLPGQAGVLPLNAVTALIGGPVVVWVLTRRARPAVVS